MTTDSDNGKNNTAEVKPGGSIDIQQLTWQQILELEKQAQDRKKQAEEAERAAKRRETEEAKKQAEIHRLLQLQRRWTGPTYPEKMLVLESMLPSQYLLYDWPEKLRIRSLRLEDVETLIAAANQDSEFLVADTVGRCINMPVGDLTIGDYYFILYWLRLNSYTKNPTLINWSCPTCMERERVLRDLPYGYTWTLVERQEFKRVSQLVGNKPKILPLQAADLVDLPDVVSLPRVRHRIEMLDWITATKPSPERLQTAEYAMYLKGESFTDRLNFLLSTDDLSLYETAMAARIRLSEHGPSEIANVKCSIQECGAEYEVPLVIQPTRFLSPIHG
jgi:hypothetical protein